MRTTVTINEELFAAAQEFTGIKEKSALLNLALRKFVEGEAAQRLILLGGTEPDLEVPPRRRPK
jgi:Arc/MetJ family transcription regulator